MVSVEEIVCNNFVVVIGSMRKGAAAVAVAQCPDGGHVRLQLIVDDDVAVVVGGNPSPVESQVVRVGSPSHGQKDVSAYDFWRTVLACDAPRRPRDRAGLARYISHSAASPHPHPPRS